MLQPLARRTWAETGHTPTLRAWERHDRLTAITALVFEPHKPEPLSMIFQVQKQNANTDSFFWFLVELGKELRNEMIVIWDRLGAHQKAAKLLAKIGCPWLSFEYLPAYSPELNPVEHVWSTTKYGRMANWPAPSLDELNTRLHQELDEQTTERELLRSHFEWAGLDLT
jgi:transposase